MQRMNWRLGIMVMAVLGAGWFMGTQIDRAGAHEHENGHEMQADAHGQATVFVQIGHADDDPHAATMAAKVAAAGLKEGRSVLVFVNLEAVRLVAHKHLDDVRYRQNEPAGRMLAQVLEEGAKIYACPHCLKAQGLTQDDLLDGVIEAGADRVIREAGDRVISFSY